VAAGGARLACAKTPPAGCAWHAAPASVEHNLLPAPHPPPPPLQVFPGEGAADTSLPSAAGWTEVTAETGTFLDSWLGMGGSGPTLVRCRNPFSQHPPHLHALPAGPTAGTVSARACQLTPHPASRAPPGMCSVSGPACLGS
jgi:hypothetical protein